ncbi:MAG: DNA repair protein RecO [Planctomycetota bacterium]
MYYPRRSGALHIVSQFHPDRERRRLGRVPLAFAAAACLCEMACSGSMPGNPAPRIFDLVSAGLDALDEGVEPVKIAIAFGLAFLSELGFAPRLEACVLCGGDLPSGASALSFERGGALCSACRHTLPSQEITPSTHKALRYLGRSLYKGVGRLALSRADATEGLSTVLGFFQAQIGRRVKSGQFFLHLLVEERLDHVA